MSRKVKPTVRSVARQAGVSTATVSRALRGDAGVTARQRENVKQAARELGYRWNPAASAVMSQLRQGHVAGYRYKITWLHTGRYSLQWQNAVWARPYFEGACRRAEETGALLDTLWLPDPRLDTERLTEILIARGARGLIIPRYHRLLERLDWSCFSFAALSDANPPHPMHVAGSDVGHGLRLAARQLQSRGYRRIGLMLHKVQDDETQGDRRAAYLLFQSELPARRRVPILMPSSHDRSLFSRLFLEWVSRHRVDAVMCCDEFVLKWAREGGCKVPDTLGLVHLVRHDRLTEWAGIDIGAAQIAAAAVDLVTGQLARGETGFPVYQKEVLVKSHWVEGGTVRPG